MFLHLPKVSALHREVVQGADVLSCSCQQQVDGTLAGSPRWFRRHRLDASIRPGRPSGRLNGRGRLTVRAVPLVRLSRILGQSVTW